MADMLTLGGALLHVKQALQAVRMTAGHLTVCPAPRW